MTTATPPTKTWYRTEFAFPTSDRCQCYKHRSSTGRSKRCPNRDCVIGLTDPDRPDNDIHRTYCLDCWITCRQEVTEISPAQQRTWDQARRQGMTLSNTGC